MRTLEDVLCDVKDRVISYCVVLEYGQQEQGLDDTLAREDPQLASRQMAITCSPAGFLGGVRLRYQGTLKELTEMDLFQVPKVLSNPPSREQLEESPYVLSVGSFVWGAGIEVHRFIEKLSERRKR